MPLATIGSPEGSNAGRFHLSVQSLTQLVTDQEDVPGRVLLICMGPGSPPLSDGPYPGTPMDKRNFFAEVLNLSTGFLDAQTDHGHHLFTESNARERTAAKLLQTLS